MPNLLTSWARGVPSLARRSISYRLYLGRFPGGSASASGAVCPKIAWALGFPQREAFLRHSTRQKEVILSFLAKSKVAYDKGAHAKRNFASASRSMMIVALPPILRPLRSRRGIFPRSG